MTQNEQPGKVFCFHTKWSTCWGLLWLQGWGLFCPQDVLHPQSISSQLAPHSSDGSLKFRKVNPQSNPVFFKSLISFRWITWNFLQGVRAMQVLRQEQMKKSVENFVLCLCFTIHNSYNSTHRVLGIGLWSCTQNSASIACSHSDVSTYMVVFNRCNVLPD